jgi:hypothetical protein
LRVDLNGLLSKNVAVIHFCNVDQVLKCFEDVQFHVVIPFNESFGKEISKLEPVVLQIRLAAGDDGVNDLCGALSNFPGCIVVVILVIVNVV